MQALLILLITSAALRCDSQQTCTPDSLSTVPKRTANSSIRCSPSEKSTVLHTQALSLPLCSWSLVPGMTAEHQVHIGSRSESRDRFTARLRPNGKACRYLLLSSTSQASPCCDSGRSVPVVLSVGLPYWRATVAHTPRS